MIKRILFFYLLLLPFVGNCQNYPITSKTIVSVLTVGTAEESHTLYGHTAIRIKDSNLNIDLVYNYGMFEFDTKNFILKFIKGDLQYFVAAYSYDEFEYNYRVENRTIYEQILDISATEKLELFNKLNTALSPENRYYTYKFIDKNCTTEVIDILNSVLKNKPINKIMHEKETYREILFPYVKNHFYQKLGINTIFGTKVDQKASKLFLPLDLLESLKISRHNNKPLISETRTVFESKKTTSKFSFADSIFSLILILLTIVLINRKVITLSYLSILGVMGLFFSLVGFYSFHQEVSCNYNSLLFNPLFLVLVYFIIKKNREWIKKIALTCIIILIVYIIYMLQKIHLVIVIPFIIANLIILIRIYLKPLLPSIKKNSTNSF
jgi:hypothetical protein